MKLTSKSNRKSNRGFTLIEIVIGLVIMSIIATITISSFVSYGKRQALDKDADAVVELVREARNLALSSKNALAYGVNFTSGSATLFPGTVYVSNDPANRTVDLTHGDRLTTDIPGGAPLLFSRLTGETDQASTVVVEISSPDFSTTTIRVYKTGIIDRISP